VPIAALHSRYDVRCPVLAPEKLGQEFIPRGKTDHDDEQAYFLGALVAGAGVSLISARAWCILHGQGAQRRPGARPVRDDHAGPSDRTIAGRDSRTRAKPSDDTAEAIASAQRVLDRQDGPTVLVGIPSPYDRHRAGVHPRYRLSFMCARAPERRGLHRSSQTISRRRHPLVSSLTAMKDASPSSLLRDFAGDLPEAKAKVLYAVQEPFHRALLIGKTRRRPGARNRASMRSPRGSHDKPGSGALHGQADGRKDDRSEFKPSLADLPSDEITG